MKETQIICKNNGYKITAQIIDGKISLLDDDIHTTENNNDWYSDNDEYIFALFKVLKKANELGAFNHLKEDEESDDKEDIEKIYV